VKYTANFGATRLIFFDAIDWNAVSSETADPSTARYLGDAYTDVTFAMDKLSDSWYVLNSLYINDAMQRFVFDGDAQRMKFHGGCGSDIQLHSSKGAIGLRIDGVQNVRLENVSISDIWNDADLGSSQWCGEYEAPNVGNEDIDIQYGYSGTRAHGLVMDYAQGTLSNVNINSIHSARGEANALTVYKECNVRLENVQIDNVHAGTQLTHSDVEALTLPNLIPRACGVDIRPNTIVTVDADTVGIVRGDDIDGFETCYDDDEDFVLAVNVSRSLRVHTAVGVIFLSMLAMALCALCLWCALWWRRRAKETVVAEEDELAPLLL